MSNRGNLDQNRFLAFHREMLRIRALEETARQGSDLTIVTWSATLHDILSAAGRAAQAGVADIEVLDLCTLWPRMRMC